MSSLNDIFQSIAGGKSVSRVGSPAGDKSVDEVSPFRVAMRMRGRQLLRYIDMAPRPRAGMGSALALSFIVSGWLYGATLGGTGHAFVSGAASTVGLEATDLVFSGQVETTDQEIFDALDMGVHGSLLGYNAEAARQRLIALPWIKDVAIRKFYPGKMTVSLTEKQAVAVWQHQDRLTVVEKSGRPIAKFGIADLINNRFSYLPHLVGDGAAEKAGQILPLVAKHPLISKRANSYIHVAERRWDIVLANGARIKLPEFGVARALEDLAELEDQNRIFEREIQVLDLRMPGRMVLRLLPQAAKDRAELVTARLKAMKKADRKL